MIKTTKLLSIALVTIMALTVVSGAGVVNVQGAPEPSLSSVAVTRTATLYDIINKLGIGWVIAGIFKWVVDHLNPAR